ncbi:MAG: putative phosphoribosyl transferase [Rhodopila sp.]|jgi:predicted phosphoribosyltransferase|nr:putative phosphoribosyl transferase [Rhodopila sp.]
MKQLPFRDRREAGRLLAAQLATYANKPDVLVVALPRGGVPVAHEVASTLGAPLDVFVVRKLGIPGYEELAMGAVATGGVRVLNQPLGAGEAAGGCKIPTARRSAQSTGTVEPAVGIGVERDKG